MPFYEYECTNCKFYSEVMQKITDAPLKKCPSCGKNTLQKLISAPVFRLKGGGWYETDFKSDKESKRNLAGDSDGSDSKSREAAAPADAKAADSKPADSKAEAKPAAAEKPSSGESGTASRSARKAAAARPAPKAAPKRKSAPKPKAKAGKRRGR
jgi:putative FmdB family regulatory protein